MISYYPNIKRFIDVVTASFALVLLLPLLILICLLIYVEDRGCPFFSQIRVGKNFKLFRLIKFRSMTGENTKFENAFQPGDNSRVTTIGRLLRKTKLDELPELLNVLQDDMSLVGPRPEVKKYVDRYSDQYRRVLSVQPGITDYASIKYRSEEEILNKHPDSDKYYREVILPDKLKMATRYSECIAFKNDLRIIIQTLEILLGPNN